MTIEGIEKSTPEFKKQHKIKVLGPFNDEQPPKWFLTYMKAFEQKFDKKLEDLKTAINSRIDNLVKINGLKE